MNIDIERLADYRRRAQSIRDTLANEGTALPDELTAFLAEFSQSEDLTPETLSAGYARISRDPRPVDEIRRDAAREVQRSRRSNQAIIFGMGHSSVAEHAVFNMDVIGISRLAVEELQRTRLASYTEKSQRYITLDGDYFVGFKTVANCDFKIVAEPELNEAFFPAGTGAYEDVRQTARLVRKNAFQRRHGCLFFFGNGDIGTHREIRNHAPVKLGELQPDGNGLDVVAAESA